MQIEELFISILNMSITASYAIVVVIVLRVFLKRAPKWIIGVLWGIVSLRLILPVSLEGMLSVFSVIPSSDTVSPEILYSEAPTIHSGIPAVNSTVNPVISESMAPATDASVSPIQIIAYIASIIWIVVIASLLIYSIVAYIRLRRKTTTGTLLSDNVYQSEHVASPFLLGFIKPKICVPYNLTEQELYHVIKHENAHIIRRDYLLKPLAFFIIVLHWFNPLVWIAYTLFCRDIELACDEKVIKVMSMDERKSYSQALLALGMQSRRIPASPLAFGEVSVKNRIKKTLSYKKPAFWIIVVALAACLVTAVCLLTDPVQKQETDPIQEIDANMDINSNTATSDIFKIAQISDLYGTYHPAEVVYVNPYSSFYPYDLDSAPYYTFAAEAFTIVKPGEEEATTNNVPAYTRSKLTASEFDDMFMIDFEKPDITSYESIERITVTDEYSLLIVGAELWLADTDGSDQIWLIYKLEPSEPYFAVQDSNLPTIDEQGLARLSIDELETLIREKGHALTWSDFEQYEYYPIGSGLYILRLPINESYCVLIGGSSPDTDPMYLRLVRLSPDGETTDEYLDLLDDSADLQGFFMDNFGIEAQSCTWRFNPLVSSVFPALPIDVNLRYSTIEVTVNSGSLYLHGNGGTQYLGQTYTYNFGETIYWSPLLEDSFETVEDAADICTMCFSVKNAQGEVTADGKILIEQTELSDYSSEYSITMIEAPDWMQLTVNTDPDSWNGFVLSPK